MAGLFKAIDFETYSKLTNEGSNNNEIEQSFGISNNEIISSMPVRQKNKCTRLLTYLKSRSQISWNALGEIAINGSSIQHSHIVDVLCFLTSSGGFKKIIPVGTSDVLDTLRACNIPTEFFGANASKVKSTKEKHKKNWVDFDSLMTKNE